MDWGKGGGGGGAACGEFANKNWALGQVFDRFLLSGGLPGGMLAAGIDLYILIYSGAYAAFSAGEGGGCTLSLSGPHVNSP